MLLPTETYQLVNSTRNRVVAFDSQRGEHRPIVDKAPVFSSAERGWRGFLFELHRVDGQSLQDVQVPHTLVGMHLGQPTRVEVAENGEFKEKLFQPGDIALIPAGTRYSIRFSGPAEFIVLSLSPELISRASLEIHGIEPSDLRILWCHRDHFISETLQNIREAAECGGNVDRTYVEMLANSLASHLVRNSNQTDSHLRNLTARGLSLTRLTNTVEFIRNTPYREISLKTMSGAAGLSAFHFARMFKLSTGLSPHQFVLKRRLEIGADMLTGSNTAISEIAAELGFADQSHFTMHFKRLNGIAPAAYRRKKRC